MISHSCIPCHFILFSYSYVILVLTTMLLSVDRILINLPCGCYDFNSRYFGISDIHYGIIFILISLSNCVSTLSLISDLYGLCLLFTKYDILSIYFCTGLDLCVCFVFLWFSPFIYLIKGEE